jgi:hypothetical protein
MYEAFSAGKKTYLTSFGISKGGKKMSEMQQAGRGKGGKVNELKRRRKRKNEKRKRQNEKCKTQNDCR